MNLIVCYYPNIFVIVRTPLATTFVAAGEELGYLNRDGNGEYQTGFMLAQAIGFSRILQGLVTQCCGSESVLDPCSRSLWIRIRIVSVFKSFVDPDPHM